jgi:hypothetical protein
VSLSTAGTSNNFEYPLAMMVAVPQWVEIKTALIHKIFMKLSSTRKQIIPFLFPAAQ